MASPNEELVKTKIPEKQDNLLAKRFVGLEKNIWYKLFQFYYEYKIFFFLGLNLLH
jgi:hypothetical protein